MGSIQYKDFELSIEKRGGQRYHAKVLRSLCGEPDIDFKLPFSKLELENFILRIGSARRSMRRINSPEMQTVRDFGGRLFESIFTGDMRSCLISSQNQAAMEGVGLRLKLRLEAPDLVNIPWEYLYDASHGRFLALFEKTPIVRYIDVIEQVKPLRVEPPLSMLVMISSPDDYPTLDVAREKANLEQAIQDLRKAGLVRITWMEQATLPALADQLMREQFNIFHFIGHGGFDEVNEDGILVLEDEYKRGYFVSGERLAVLLGNQSSLRMAVLNSCEGGRTSSTDPFAGVATTLVRTGSVSAVVAMQLAITDQAAITFARGLYNALSVGRPVDAAVTQARLAIFAESNDVEWGTPVLYMRSPDGSIFDIATAGQVEIEQPAPVPLTVDQAPVEPPAEADREAEERQNKLAELYEAAFKDLNRQEWSKASQILLLIQALEPDYRDTTDLLERAKLAQEQLEREADRVKQEKEAREHKLATLYEEAYNNLNRQEWAAAKDRLLQIRAIEPGYRDAADLLERAKLAQEQLEREAERVKQEKEARERKLASLYEEAYNNLNRQEWAAAKDRLIQIRAIEPGYRDAADLLERAKLAQEQLEREVERVRKEKEARERQLATLYEQAGTRLKIRDWTGALELLKQAGQIDSHYRDLPALIEQANQEKIKAEKFSAWMTDGKNGLEKKEWRLAAESFRQALKLVPDSKEAQARLEEARAALEPPTLQNQPVKPPRPSTLPEKLPPGGKPKDLPR